MGPTRSLKTSQSEVLQFRSGWILTPRRPGLRLGLREGVSDSVCGHKWP